MIRIFLDSLHLRHLQTMLTAPGFKVKRNGCVVNSSTKMAAVETCAMTATVSLTPLWLRTCNNDRIERIRCESL